MNNESVLVTQQRETTASLSRSLYYIFKRIFDILVGLIGIMFMIPLTLIIKVASIANKDYDSIFFSQERIGKDGKLFTLYKFRTMVPDADNILYQLMQSDEEFRKEYTLTKKAKNDPRITKIGRVLRKTSLDEFPQFINVLLGHMSLIGNRPYLPREKEDMGEYYKDIIATKPGITGLWQTSGRSNTTFEERLQLEQKYSLVNSMKMDIKIFFKTIIQVLKREGAN